MDSREVPRIWGRLSFTISEALKRKGRTKASKLSKLLIFSYFSVSFLLVFKQANYKMKEKDNKWMKEKRCKNVIIK